MSREQDFKNAITNARRIWETIPGLKGPIVRARASPVVRFRNQANINQFIRVLGSGVIRPMAHVPNAPNGRRLRPNTNYVLMRSYQPFNKTVRVNFPLNKGYYSSSPSNHYGLTNKNTLYRTIGNLSRQQLRTELTSTPAKGHIAAAKVAQILGNAIERRRKLKNNLVYFVGLRKARKYNSPVRKRQANNKRIATARRRASVMASH